MSNKQKWIQWLQETSFRELTLSVDFLVTGYIGYLYVNALVNASPEQLAGMQLDFEDKKFDNLLFKYRARNWPQSLSQDELDQWRQYCQNKLMHGEDQPSISAQDFMITLENLAHEHDDNEKNLTILKALYNYAQSM